MATRGKSEADLELLKQESQAFGEEFGHKELINDESTLEARRLKEAGNAEFQREHWAKSIKIYTKAILLPGIPCADRAALYSNRSAAYLKQNKLSLAMEDAKKTIEILPEWWKGHHRMGRVYTEMNKYKKAEACFDEALSREPDQEEILEARSYARMKQSQLDRNDASDALLAIPTLDIAISKLKSRTTSEVNAKAVKNLLHAKVKDTSLQNWQDCQRGYNCLAGAGGSPQDYKMAAQYFKKAADRGSAEGLFELALLTMEGKGVKRDMKMGIRMLKETAEKPSLLNGVPNGGVAEAEHALGLYYQDGIGVPKDELAAVVWFKRAAEHGNLGAANNLGVIYRAKGDFVKAEQYLKMAANAGDAKAMWNLAAYYYSSRSDPDAALIWCQRARNAGMIGPEIDYIEKSCKDASSTSIERRLKELFSQNGEKSATVRNENAFRPALSDPGRENLTKRLRRLIATSTPRPCTVTISSFTSCNPTKLQTSARSLKGLKAITLHEMDQQLDKVYNGYVLAVTIVEDILFMASMQTIIEDSCGDVLLCAIYNWQNMHNKVRSRKEFGIGCKIRIVNPYMRMAVDGNSVIRVDDPASIVFDGFLEKMCRYCCEPNARKACAKCKASYCGKECQTLDWKRDHKLICGRLP